MTHTTTHQVPSTTHEVPSAQSPCPWDAANTVLNWLDTHGNGVEYLSFDQKCAIRRSMGAVLIYSQA